MTPEFVPANWLQALVVFALVGAAYVPLGDYMARVYSRSHDLRVEKAVYRICGIDPGVEQPWTHYLRSLLTFSAVSTLGLFTLLRLQDHLPFDQGKDAVPAALASNTAVSFVTNTSWQNYAGEATLLACSALAVALPTGQSSIGNPGPHGVSEIVYAFTSATTGNGSAFASLTGNTGFYNTALGLAMLIGRYLPMIFVVALAGRLAAQQPRSAEGSLRTDTALVVGLVVVTVIVVGLEFLPVLTLGPLAEGMA